MTDFFLAGWCVRSDLALPELALWNGDEREPDLIIRCLKVVPDMDGLVALSPVLDGRNDGLARLNIPEVATYIVDGGCNVRIIPRDTASEQEIRLFLFGPVLGLICHQRGLFPLRASCVQLKQGAIALVGPSGVGKSTIATNFSIQGNSVLSDDPSIFDFVDGKIQLLPTTNQVKLWQDTLDRFNIPSVRLIRTRKTQHRYFYRLRPEKNHKWDPIYLKGLYFLERTNESRPTIESLSIRAATSRIYYHLCQGRFALYLNKGESLRTKANFIASEVRCFRLAWDLSSKLNLITTVIERITPT